VEQNFSTFITGMTARYLFSSSTLTSSYRPVIIASFSRHKDEHKRRT